MKLKELLKPLPGEWIILASSGNPEIRSIACDSRRVEEGSLFFAIRGTAADGKDYIPQALERGASAIATEDPIEGLPVPMFAARPIRKVMAECSNHLLGYPSRQMSLTGITGTNGKTTIAHILDSIFSIRGPSLLLGTIKTSIGNLREEAGLTTPESIDLHRILRQASEQKIERGVMEVSSHALAFDRVFGISFPTTVFTNLTTDHLDFHKDLEEYFSSKSLLFDREYNTALKRAVINIDDPFGKRLADITEAECFSYGMGRDADIFPLQSESTINGIRLRLETPWGVHTLESPLCGKHNLYNLMAAFGAALAQGILPDQAIEGIGKLASVPGRFQKLELDRPFSVVLDYAHTPDALKNVLDLAHSVSKGKIISVFGCGGDRDRSKRPEMARIGVSYSDKAIITSDNPRTEDPERIIEDMKAGISGDLADRSWEVIVDRKSAIARALEIAGRGDLVLLAGKGHEDYQVIASGKIPFNEETIVKEILCSK